MKQTADKKKPSTIQDDFANSIIVELRAYAEELRSYASGLHTHLEIVRQMDHAEIKINAWNNRLQTLLGEFQDTAPLLAELTRRTNSIVSNLAGVSIPQETPDDVVLLVAQIDFNLIEDTANYAEYHAENFWSLFPMYGKRGDFTEEDREALCQCVADARAARGAKDSQRANGRRQARHLKRANADRASSQEAQQKKSELKKAVAADKRKYPNPKTERSKGHWKDLLSIAPSYETPDALRMAVTRARNKTCGQYDRTGKKRGPYKKQA